MSGAPGPRGIHRWTPSTYLLLAFGAGLLLLAVALHTPVPVFVALALLVAPFAAAMSYPRALTRADLAWEEVGLGDSMQVNGSLTGEFGTSARNIVVELAPPPGVIVTERLVCDYRPREIRFRTQWRIGEPTISTVAPPPVVWSDPMGLCERTLDGKRPRLAVERFPLETHGLTAVRLDRTIPLPGETPSARRGPSGEFAGLRPALTNEPFRQINWRATARAGRWMANEFETALTGDLIVLLDLRSGTYGRSQDERLLGIGRAAAYGIAESFLRNKVRIGFASFGELIEAVPLSTGRAHRLRILEAILRCQLVTRTGDPSRSGIGLRRFFVPGVTTLIISSCTGDPSLDLAPYIRRSGFPVVTLSPSPAPMRYDTGGLSARVEQLARRIERLERRARLSHLWTYGPVVDWDDYWSLHRLVRSFRAPARRGSL